jgi:hypothetical protein
MKQRSAMVVAAGLVVALALAGLGIMMGMTGPSADAKAPHLRPRPPIVDTTTRTITVHKPGSATSDGSSTTWGSSTAPSTAMSGSDDGFESSNDDATEIEDGFESQSGSSHDGGFSEGSDD